MGKIRVLIVDDSVVLRRMLSEFLSSDPAIEVVGTAPDGKIGLAKITQVNPDIVILDLEMPVLDGLGTLRELRKIYKTLPVIVFSTLTEHGATATLEALTLGASDYATKSPQVDNNRDNIFSDLIPKIKALCHRETVQPLPQLKPVPAKTTGIGALQTISIAAPTRVAVLTIGVSTGGPNALAVLFSSLTKNFPVPILIVQHMPQMFTRLLAERLSAVSGFNVHEGKAGELVKAGDVWVAPGGQHMDVEKTATGIQLRIHEGPPENSCRPAVDVLFRSVAQVYGASALAVVMTGMGQDGLRGCENIREKGGRVFIQDEASSVVWGMPGAVSRAGLAQKTLPLSQLAEEINRSVRNGSSMVETKDLTTRPANTSLSKAA